jgi:hypothetical protein
MRAAGGRLPKSEEKSETYCSPCFCIVERKGEEKEGGKKVISFFGR